MNSKPAWRIASSLIHNVQLLFGHGCDYLQYRTGNEGDVIDEVLRKKNSWLIVWVCIE